MATPMFTIGSSNSDDKMDMSLDQIIKQEKASKPRRQRITTSPTAAKGSLRRRDLANKAVKRATQVRTGGVQSRRGIQSTEQEPKVRKAPRATTVDSDWLTQQKQRQAASRNRLQQYSKKVGTTATSNGNTTSSGPSFTVTLSNNANTFNSSNRPGFQFETPSFLSGNSGNNTRNVNNRVGRTPRSNVKNITINVSNERAAPQRSRQQQQQRQSIAVSALRGVTADANKGSTLNDRFGSSKKPTNNRQNVGRTITLSGAPRNNVRNAPASGRSVLFN